MRACAGSLVGSLVAITAGSALSLAGLLAPGAASAATGSWSPLGPDGGPVTSLAIDPVHAGTIYAGTQLGYVFKSTSAGANWAAASPRLAYRQVDVLAIDPANPTTLYAGTDSGLFKTVDGAGTWSLINSGNNASAITALAVDPVHTATLFAATAWGLAKSTDGGTSWSTVDTTISVHVLAIDRAHPATVYAGYEAGVLKSSDGGASWNDAPGLPPGSFEALAIDPANPATVYAGGGAYYGVPGMVKTSDGGATWTAINSGLPLDFSVAALAIDPAMPATVYTSLRGGGVFKTTDGGASWTAIGASLDGLDVYALAIDATNPNLLFAGTVAGVFKSTDAGAGWGAVDTGLAALQVSTMAIDPVSSATLYVGTPTQGVFKSVDSGASWTAASSGLASLDSLVVYALVIDPTNTATLYAGTQAGVFKTSDAGRSWTAVNSGLPINSLYTTSLAIDPIHPATLYAATGEGVWKTTDGGASWTEANAGNYSGTGVLVIDPTTPTTLYSAYSGVSKSTDGGASWTDASSGLGSIGLGDFIQALAIDPSHPATLYAATNRGVAKTTDGGATWHAVNCGLPPRPDNYFTALAIDPVHPGTLYTGYAGIFKSADGGASWTAVPGALSGILTLGLTFDPKTSTLYAATSGRSVFALTGGAPPNPTTMQCIDDFAGDARFQLTVHFHTRQGGGQSGNGQAISLSSLGVSHGGLFWFFSPGNPEMLVKVLDACVAAKKFWVFYSAGTNVAFTTTVRDNKTGVVRTYTNPDLAPAPPVQDTNAFDCTYDIPRARGDQDDPAGGRPGPRGAVAAHAKVEPAWPAAPAPATTGGAAPRSFAAAAGGGCSPGPATLCIGGRFKVEAAYHTTQGGGRSGMAQAIALASLGVDQGGLFWFFDAGNPEMLIKVIDGCSLTGKYWVFASAGTNVGLTVTVTDTLTGSSAIYTNPDLTAAPPIQDTAALPCG